MADDDRQKRAAVSNRRALHDYEILDRYEAGLELQGTEVKSLRAGHASLAEAFAQIRDGEAWLVGATIEPYAQGNRANHDPRRERKLLLHKAEIDRIQSRVAERGLTLVPLRIYFAKGRAKIEIGLGRGRASHDKRHALAERDARREIDRALRQSER